MEKLRTNLPQTKVLLLAIFPRGADNQDPVRRIKVKTNEIISKLADSKNVFYLDISPKFLAADGKLGSEIMPDLLHPNAKGYEIWAESHRADRGEADGRKVDPAPGLDSALSSRERVAKWIPTVLLRVVVVAQVVDEQPKPWGFWATAGLSLAVMGTLVFMQSVTAVGFIVLAGTGGQVGPSKEFIAHLTSNGLLLSLATWFSLPFTLGLTVLFVRSAGRGRCATILRCVSHRQRRRRFGWGSSSSLWSPTMRRPPWSAVE